MPQKKNPDSLELIRGKAGRIHGKVNSLYYSIAFWNDQLDPIDIFRLLTKCFCFSFV